MSAHQSRLFAEAQPAVQLLGLLRFAELRQSDVNLDDALRGIDEMSPAQIRQWTAGTLITFVPCRMGRRCRVEVTAEDEAYLLDHGVDRQLHGMACNDTVSHLIEAREAGISLWPWDSDDLRKLRTKAPDPGVAAVLVARLLGLWYASGVTGSLAWRLARVGLDPMQAQRWTDFSLAEVATWAQVAYRREAAKLRHKGTTPEQARLAIDSRTERPLRQTRGYPTGPWLSYPRVANNWVTSVRSDTGCLVCWEKGVADLSVMLCVRCEERYGTTQPGALTPAQHAQQAIRLLVGLDDGRKHDYLR